MKKAFITNWNDFGHTEQEIARGKPYGYGGEGEEDNSGKH
jgi:hypothetical protein